MADAKRDDNNIPSALWVSSVDGSTTVPLKVNPVTWRVLVDIAWSSWYVTWPWSSTDEAIARYDGTTWKIIQDSNVTIDDSWTVNIPSWETYNINWTPIWTPWGSDTQIQFNDWGSFWWEAEFIYDKTKDSVWVGWAPEDFTIDWVTVTPIVEQRAENNNLWHNTLTRHSNTVELCARTFNLRARWTLATPLAVQNWDTLNCYIVWAHDWTEYRNSARIRTEASWAVSTGIVPTTMKLQTSNTSGTLQSWIEIDESQDVSIPNWDITANNLSGTNTGDQTSIVWISGTKAEYDTSCSDGNFVYDGDNVSDLTNDAWYITDSSTDTFTNKTFDANWTWNSLSNVDVANLANGTDWELITWDASWNPATVAVWTATHVLTSNWVWLAPTFQAAPWWGFTSSARAYVWTNQTWVVTWTYTKISLDTENYDIDWEFDPTTNYRFTATSAGRYVVSAGLRLQYWVSWEVDIAIYVNGALNTIFQAITTAEKRSVNVSDILNLSATDYVELYCRQWLWSDNIIQNWSNQSFMSISRIQ